MWLVFSVLFVQIISQNRGKHIELGVLLIRFYTLTLKEMGGTEEEFVEWLGKALEEFSLNDAAYVDYIKGIITETTSTDAEKTEAISEFLSAATVRCFVSCLCLVTHLGAQSGYFHCSDSGLGFAN